LLRETDGDHFPRLRLVPLSDNHLEFEIELESDPEVVRFIGDGSPRSRLQVEQRNRNRLARAGQVLGLGFWAGFLRPGMSSQPN
jgi:hypothetical protein